MSFNAESTHPYIMNSRIKAASGTGGIGNIPIASDETLGGIKVPADSGITIDGSGNAYAAKQINYSANEVDTGLKWNDKHIYCKEVVKNISQYGTVIEGVDHVVDIKGYFNDGRDHSINMYDFQIQSNSGTVQFGSSASGTLHIIIFYTKNS